MNIGMNNEIDIKSGIGNSVISFLIAILSGLGVGSGGLLVIWLTMVQGITAQDARGLNLLFFVFSASAALVFHILRKRLNYKLIFFMAIFASVGTAAGSYLGAYISSGHLRKIFGIMLIISGIYTLASRLRAKTRGRRSRQVGKSRARSA